MRRCKAVGAWPVGLLVVLGLTTFAGCNSLQRDDPLSSYSLPGDVDPNRGVLTKFTDEVVQTARASMGRGPNEQAAQEQFAEAMSIYKGAAAMQGQGNAQREFERAAKLFSKAALRWPNSSIEEDALFFEAEANFFADRYPKAEILFGKIFSKYQSTKYLDRISQRRFQIAKYWLDHHTEVRSELAIAPNFTSRDRPTFDKFGHAIKVLERIRLDDPTGELADDATMLAASACFDDGRFFRADELLTDLRRSFPSSNHQYAAHMMGLKCKIQLYQGPSYDSGPLDDSEELVRQMRRQFPTESGKDTDFLAKAFKDIRMNRAIREWKLAEYRDRRKEYRAARIQYERVARDFADTSLAGAATERLAQLGGSPDLPPQRLEWLAKAFPSDDDQQPLLR